MKPIGLPMAMVLVLVTGACGGSGGGAGAGDPAPMPGMASPGPTLVIERFLQAANANELETMMELFGTAERTIAQLDGQAKAERRMHVLASLLRHDDYEILNQRGVPGRLGEATQLDVRIQQGEQSTVVPHVVVRRANGNWIIERIEVERLTRGG